MPAILTNLNFKLRTPDRVLYLIGFLCAVIFIASIIPFHPYSGSFIIKAVPCLCLSLIVLRNVKGIQGKLLIIGLLFSAAGDVTLDIDRKKLFILGLIFFLLAHVFYIIAFSRNFQIQKSRFFIAAILIVYALIIGFLLRNIPGKRLVPVMVYLLVITIMAVTASFISTEWKIIFCGALIFMISDTVIAINKFLIPIPNSTVFNISIYYIAQFIIVTGFVLREKHNQ